MSNLGQLCSFDGYYVIKVAVNAYFYRISTENEAACLQTLKYPHWLKTCLHGNWNNISFIKSTKQIKVAYQR